MRQADQIRKYAEKHFISDRKLNVGEIVEISARQVHDGLGLDNRFPNVVSSLSTRKFWEPLGLHPLFKEPMAARPTAVLRFRKS